MIKIADQPVARRSFSSFLSFSIDNEKDLKCKIVVDFVFRLFLSRAPATFIIVEIVLVQTEISSSILPPVN